jgi:hypothetical protein
MELTVLGLRAQSCMLFDSIILDFCCRVQGSGLRVLGSRLRVKGSGFRVWDSGFRVWVIWLKVKGIRFGV